MRFTVIIVSAFFAPLAVDAIEHDIHTADGFRAELVYEVDTELHSSWVALTVDPTGRLIAGAQSGGVYRTTLPKDADADVQVEQLPAPLGDAQGLLAVGDSLYVMTNRPAGSGLYRAVDRDGDDRFETIEKLFALDGAGEHGPHGLALGPDGNSIYFCAGNQTRLPKFQVSLVPTHWGDDQLLARLEDPRGYETGLRVPGGWIARCDLDGKNLELVSVGYRNQYDLAFNTSGELFTVDADMEWDIGTPWSTLR